MKTYFELSVHQKIYLKQSAIKIYGHGWHTERPDFLKRLNILQIHTILN